MKIIPVNQASFEKLDEYLKKNEQLERKVLLPDGYVIETANHIAASFALSEINNADLWLKQLYITEAKADQLLVVLEMIIQLAKLKRAKSLYVYSHQPAVDILLEALRFSPENSVIPHVEKQVTEGNWWMYAVS